ncbi:MAG: integrin alpha, partial [Aphanizomenon sp.]
MEELTTTGTEPAELDSTTSNPLILEDPLDSSNPSTELGNTTSETGTVEEIPFEEALDQSADPNADIEDSYLIAINNTTGEIITIDALTGEIVRTSIDTSDNKGFIIQGVSDDNLGYSVSSAGDINDDGIGDIVIGSPLSDPNNQSNAGKTYVVFGKTDLFNQTIDISSLNGTNGFVINGAKAGDESGRSVSNIGDINGDGVDDLAIGAPGGIGNSLGSAYVIFGSEESDYFNNPIELSNLDGKGFEIQGSELFTNRNAGWAISAAGDINGDGFKDLLIGASNPGNNESGTIGESYVIFGKENFDSTLNIDGPNFGNDGLIIYSYNEDNPNDDNNSLGYSVSDAGDINGDGIDDLIIGAPYADPNGNNSGSSYVIYGRSEDNPFTDNINIFNFNSSDGFVINGQNGDKSGFSVSKAGDINGDGIGDLIIGAKDGNPDNKESAGRSYVVFGSEDFDSSINLSDLDGSNGFAINGISARDNSGWSVGALGDINGDGIDDIIVGANNANSTAGQSYVIYGNDTGFDSTFELSSLESPDSQNGFIIDGAFIGDNLGHSVRGAGDVNGDGVNDLIIGAPFANNKAGRASVLFGTSPDGTDPDDGTDP